MKTSTFLGTMNAARNATAMLALSALGLLAVECPKPETPAPAKSTAAEITEHVLAINGTEHTVTFTDKAATVSVTYSGTAPTTAATKTLNVSDKATACVAEGSTLTFTNNQAIITITAEDGTTKSTYIITLAQNPPAIPTGLTATVISAKQIDLSWTAAPTAKRYELYDGGAPIDKNIPTISYHHTGLTTSSTHNYTLKACNDGECSAASAVVSMTTLPPITLEMVHVGIKEVVVKATANMSLGNNGVVGFAIATSTETMPGVDLAFVSTLKDIVIECKVGEPISASVRPSKT